MGYVRWINRVSESGVTSTVNSTSSFDFDLETDKWYVIELYENLWTGERYASLDQVPKIQIL